MTRRLSPDVLGDSCAFWFGDMHLPVDDSSGNGWRTSIDEATGVPNGVDVNGPLPSTYLDGSTPKAQPPESSWGQFNLAPADLDSSSNWSLRTGLTPTGTDSALWSNTSTATLPHQQQRSQQIKAAATQHLPRATAPMPIPERSSTEPLWRRRLNAKNYELQQLHSRMSAPDVNMSNKALSPPKSAQESLQPTVRQEPNHTWHSQSDMVVNDHDFTHASPNALRMLGIDPNSFQQTMPIANVQHSNGGMAAFESTGNGIATAGRNAVGNDNAFAAPMVMMETLNSDSLPPQHGYAPHSSSLPHYDSMAMLDYDARQSPRAFRRSMHDADLHMFGDSASSPATAMYVGTGYRTSSSNDFDLDGSSAYMASGFAPSSADLNAAQASSDDSTMHFSANGKGVINKVIVPSTNGAPSDAVDIRTGEAGQMRHVCPHPGCDKHFSTSGHARRHSRIHDCLRPFECPHQGCHATFTRRDNCTQHQRARHRFQLVAHRIGDEQ